MIFKEEILPNGVIPKEIKNRGIVVGHYYEGGYLTRSAFLFNKIAFYKPAIYRCSYVLTQLNETATVDDIFDYVRSFSFNGFSFSDKSFIEKAFSNACEDLDNNIRKYYNSTKYKFYDYVSAQERREVVGRNSRNVNHHKIVDEIDSAIEVLMSDGEFVHSGSIKSVASKNIKMSSKTIRAIVSAFHRERVDRYNNSLFGNKDYYAYLRASNEHKIEEAILKEQTLNKRKIGKVTKLHYNTVANLWNKEWEGRILR